MPGLVISDAVTSGGAQVGLLFPNTTLLVTRTGSRVTTDDGASTILLAATGLHLVIEGGVFALGRGEAYGLSADTGLVFTTEVSATGRIFGTAAAVDQEGGRLTNAGHLSGTAGVLAGASTTLVNSGLIEGSETGIRGGAAAIRVENSGRIAGGDDGLRIGLAGSLGPYVVNNGTILGGMDSIDSGVELTGLTPRVINNGTIQGFSGVSFATTGINGGELVNTGTIGTTASLAVGRAVTGSNGQDFVTNAGTMVGDVSLQGGNDRYDGTLGRIMGAADLGGEVFGGTGNDTLLGGDGRERLFGDVGADLLEGGAGNDLLVGGTDADTLDGGDGDDVLRPGAGADEIDGGAGTRDMLDYLGSASVWVNLSTGEFAFGDAAGDVATGVEWIGGSNTTDRLTGDAGANVLYGRGGADILAGEGGNDILNGGEFGDVLRGGTGADVLRGGTGLDRFAYLLTAESTATPALRDRIADFTQAQGDLIDIDGIDASTLGAGDQDFVFIGGAGFSAAGQVRSVAFNGNTLVSANTDANTTTVEFSVLLLGSYTLTAADFDL